jgi:hypothetical protein
MASNTSINLVNLDFDSFKNQLKTYLKAQDTFKDYDFDGSNMSVLLDILSYNTYLNAFYLNMIGNEMFLDSAQLRESVISRAKELNYLPRSFKSAKANVTVSVVTDGTKSTITMPKGTTFSTRVGANTFTFSTDQNIVFSGANTTFVTDEITLYEGAYVNDTFTINYADPRQRFILNNPTIDTDSLTVTVIENNGSDVLTYLRATSLFGKQSNSQIYFIQGAENEKYEILFGDGVIGRKPKDNAIVVCDYRITKGELPNGAFKFTSDGPIGGFSNVSVNTITSASQGLISETIESIKFNAPRYFTSQERAITSEDYKNLLMINFPEINAVSVYGGEEIYPPQFGKVFIAVDLKNVDGVPDIRKEQYYNFIKPRCSLSIDPIFIDPDFMYLDVETIVRYNINLTALNVESIRDAVLTSIMNYNDQYIDDFDVTFRYSGLVRAIDATDRSIISNDTTVRAIRTLIPNIARVFDYDIDFQQALQDDLGDLADVHESGFLSAITSSNFISEGKEVKIEDDGQGNLILKSVKGNTHTKINNIGTVDYTTGELSIKKLKVDSYNGEFIKIYARIKFKDIDSRLGTILSIREQDVRITVSPERA